MSETTEFLTEYSQQSYAESLIPKGATPIIYSTLDDFVSKAPGFLFSLVGSAVELTESKSGKIFL